jgi:peptidyl-prolyl cis-trans isomerase D
MLSNIRTFSKTILAKILLVIIIVPFVFWGMGGVFNGGNTNNIVKINNDNISTQDFIDYLNKSKINSEIIRNNLDKNILEEILAELVSKKILEEEMKDLNIIISENSLAQKIRKNKNFSDKNGNFSRIKYEKFLLEQNLTATDFEKKLKENHLRKKLFSYVSGGINSPTFLINKTYKEQTSKLEIQYLNLKNVYKSKKNFSEKEIKIFINTNIDQLKDEYIDFSYLIISPKDLIGTDEFSEVFFKEIDQIENKVSNGVSFNDIANELKINPIIKIEYISDNNENLIEKKIYDKRNESKFQLINEDEFYVLYEIQNINRKLPNLLNQSYRNRVVDLMYQENKFEYNKNLLSKIQKKEFKEKNFLKLANNKPSKLTLNSIKDNEKFGIDSIKILYSLPINSYTLIADNFNDIYLARIMKLSKSDPIKKEILINKYSSETNIKIRDSLYFSYDFYLSKKYNVVINQKTVERVKNYFR